MYQNYRSYQTYYPQRQYYPQNNYGGGYSPYGMQGYADNGYSQY